MQVSYKIKIFQSPLPWYTMRYRKIGNKNRPIKNKNVKWAFISTTLDKRTDTNFPWESFYFTLEKFQKKVLESTFQLHYMVSNFEKKTIYDIIRELVSNKNQTIFTNSFHIEENFIFDHKINDTYTLKQVCHEEPELQYFINTNDDIITHFNYPLYYLSWD